MNEYLKDMNATRACIRAGYKSKNAKQQAHLLLSKSHVKRAVDTVIKERADKLQLDAEWVLERLVALHDRCMQTVPVTNKEGKETGEFKFDASNANRSLELIGKHLGMFAPDNILNISQVNNPEVEDAREELRKITPDTRKKILELVRGAQQHGKGTA